MPDCRSIFASLSPDARIGLLAALAAVLSLTAGCGPEPKIRQYTVPELAVNSSASGKAAPGPMAMPAAEQSTLGAIVLTGQDAWFFKLTGDPDAVAAQRAAVTKFLRQVRFSTDGKPTWEVPDGWKERPASGLRFATLEVGDPPLELAISPLSRGPDGPSDEEYILQNVNRWRDQLGLEPTTSEALAKESEQFSMGEFPVTLVELTGFSSGTMGGPFSGGGGPFAGGGELPKDHPPVNGGQAVAAPTKGERGVKYKVPAGWNELPAKSLRVASFEVVDGDKKLDISVIPLSLDGPAGDVVENVNRWRGQVGLAPQSKGETDKELRDVSGPGITWQVVELTGQNSSAGPQAILGAIGKSASATWFVKLIGPPDLAKREAGHFDEFLATLEVK